MCGRFLLSSPLDAVRAAFAVATLPEASNFAPRYNIAPTQPVWAVRAATGGRELVRLHWGLVPAWMEAPPKSRPMINARAETVSGKPAFRAAYRRRRCLLPADGWYEWQAQEGAAGSAKQPYLIRPRAAKERPFAFAGIWEHWTGGETDGAIESVAILTVDAADALAGIHPRMPMLLARTQYDEWLDPAAEPADAAALAATPPGGFEVYPVSRRVNSPARDDATLAAPAGHADRTAHGAQDGQEDQDGQASLPL